jgi:hypothetical protein
MSTVYTGQKAALINIKTVASSSGGEGSPTTATTSAPRVGTIPKVILYWGANNANSETLNARYVEYPSIFANSDSSSSTTHTLINKNPNFAFTVNSWPTINRGDIITAILDSSTNRVAARDLRIQLINVLNPLQAANYNSVSLGSTSVILPPAINDNNGQNSKFVIPNSVSGGYYIVNVFTEFQDKEFNAVYTGKLYIPYLQNKVTVSRTRTNTIIKSSCPAGTEKVGAECLKICQKGEERIDGKCVPKCNENEERDSNGQCVPTPEQDGSVRQPDCNDPANKGLAACNAGAGTDAGTGTIVPPDQGGSSDHESKDSHKRRINNKSSKRLHFSI